ncbi:MAG: hypothetical protein MZV65_29045 [Chromatiales bacterium]|nr:hypothetical protein [Chromatiales bacterium]
MRATRRSRASATASGANDDNEDGIVNGEAIALPITSFNRLGGADATTGNYLDAHGFVAPTQIYVDASHIFGTRPHAGTDPGAQYPKFYANNTAYTEPVQKALRASHRLQPDVHEQRLLPAGARRQHWRPSSSTGVTCTPPATWTSRSSRRSTVWRRTGSPSYELRTRAYDKAGNEDIDWTEPIEFTFDLTGPSAAIPGCGRRCGAPPVDFTDVSATLAGVQIWDSGKHPGKYTLTANAGDATR